MAFNNVREMNIFHRVTSRVEKLAYAVSRIIIKFRYHVSHFF